MLKISFLHLVEASNIYTKFKNSIYVSIKHIFNKIVFNYCSKTSWCTKCTVCIYHLEQQNTVTSYINSLFPHQIQTYLRQEKVPNMAPAAIPTAKPIMKPILTRSKQLGWVWPYGPTATGIYRGLQQQKNRLKTS